MEYQRLVQQWRETSRALLADDPDDRAGNALNKCAANLEKAIASKAGIAAAMSIVMAATALIGEVAREVEEHHNTRSFYTTTSLAPPPALLFENPLIPNEHDPQERDEEVIVTLAGPAASGTNVAANVVSNTYSGSQIKTRRL